MSSEKTEPKTYDELEKELNDLVNFFNSLTPIKLPFKIPGVDKDFSLECLVSKKASEQIRQISESLGKYSKKSEDNKLSDDNISEDNL